jgi:hypothetical protein
MQCQRIILRAVDSRFLSCCVLAFFLLTYGSAHALADWPWKPRKANFPEARQVAKIQVAVFGFPSGTVEQERSIDNKEQIAKLLAILERCREGWKKVLVTEANGDVVMSFRSIDSKAAWPLCQVRMGKGWISTHIDGRCHSRAISPKDQFDLLNALGVNASALDHRTDRAGNSAKTSGPPLVRSRNRL